MILPRHVILIAFLSATAQAFDRDGNRVGQRHQHRHHHQNGDQQGPRVITSLSRHHVKQEQHLEPTNEATTKPQPQRRHRHHHNQKDQAGAVNQQKHVQRLPLPLEGKRSDTEKPMTESNKGNGQGYQLQRYHLRGENTQVLRFKLSARALPSKDRLSKSDPYVIIHYSDAKEEPEMIMGRTTSLNNNEDPTWEEVFTFPYDPSANQRWHFAIFDRDTRGQDDLIGSALVKVKYYVDHGQYLKLEIQSDSATRPRDSVSQPLLIIAKE